MPAGARSRDEVLGMLHQNILDVFNEHGVLMMSPHDRGDPEGPKVVPQAHWHEAPARPIVEGDTR
jgi:hypothetical protein